MIIVEFLDKSNIDNLCSSLIKAPERVIFVSSAKNGISLNLLDRYKRFFAGRGLDIICEGMSLNPFKIDKVTAAFERITEKYDECVFDLTGGNESYIVAATAVATRYPERRIQLQKINISTGNVIDLDRDGKTILDSGSAPSLTVEETISINGGRIVYEDERTGGTHRWDDSVLDDVDVDVMWEIMRSSPTAWNSAVGVLERFVRLDDGALKSVRSGDPKLPSSIADSQPPVKKVFERLNNKGLIKVEESDGRETVTFATDTIERVLSKSGNLLELQVYRLAKRAENAGKKIFNDALTGVLIDIDGNEDDSMLLTNEIDVIIQKGLKPIFVSCKNGDVDNDELYKLRTVTARFGGKYAKAVLVLAAPRGAVSSMSLKERAKEYHITVIEAYSMSDLKFAKRIAHLASS